MSEDKGFVFTFELAEISREEREEFKRDVMKYFMGIQSAPLILLDEEFNRIEFK